MKTLTRTAVTTVGLLAALGVPSAAFADGLTVTLPCGCQPVQDQPVGAATGTPAVDNPSGTVGNTSGAGTDSSGLSYPSGSASFGG